MFNSKNLLYYSTNEELERPAPENEEDFVGELHTATSVIAKVEDEEGAQEIVKRVNMHDELIKVLQDWTNECVSTVSGFTTIDAKRKSERKVIERALSLLKQAEQK